jgi:hypothetical protein
VGPRAGLDDVEKRKFLTLPGLELRPLGRPPLCRIRYPGSMGTSYKTSLMNSSSGLWNDVSIRPTGRKFLTRLPVRRLSKRINVIRE